MKIKSVKLFGTYDSADFSRMLNEGIERAQRDGDEIDIQYSCAASGRQVYYSALLIVRGGGRNERLS